MIDLAPNSIYGLQLANPVMVAAGCFGFAAELAGLADLPALGALVSASITLRPRRPGTLPRLLETPGGLLWSGSVPNSGAEATLRRYAESWASLETRLILSLAGDAPDEFGALAEGFEGVEGVAGLELRLPPESAPAVQILRRARRATELPLLAKLPALDAGLGDYAAALAAAGADALVYSGMRPALLPLADGKRQQMLLCGPALHPLALRQFAELAEQVDLPLIASGGIGGVSQARAFLELGAAAVQIGSAALADPALPGHIARELAAS